MKKFATLLFLMFALMLGTTGCYLNEDVNPGEVGVVTKSNAIVNVVGPGVYTDLDVWAEIGKVSVGTMTFSVEDPEVLASDDQAVGVKITIQARRLSDKDSITNLVTNWNSLIADQGVIDTVSATAREGLKNGVRRYTLTQLLNDRNGLAGDIRAELELDATKYSVSIINVTVENIGPSTEYMGILAATANIKAQTEQEVQRKKLIEQTSLNNIYQAQQSKLVLDAELEKTKSQTAIDVEIATREGKKVAAANEVYSMNPQAFEIKRLELLKELFGQNVTYFLPEGTDPSMFFNFSGTPVPTQP